MCSFQSNGCIQCVHCLVTVAPTYLHWIHPLHDHIMIMHALIVSLSGYKQLCVLRWSFVWRARWHIAHKLFKFASASWHSKLLWEPLLLVSPRK